MKSITSRILNVAFIVALAACGKKDGNQDEPASSTSPNQTYEAVFTCGMPGSGRAHSSIALCFSGNLNGPNTELEIKNGDQYKMYTLMDLANLQNEDSDGFHMKLNNHFVIKAQNAAQYLLLTLTITDPSGKVVFQKSATQYGVISVQN